MNKVRITKPERKEISTMLKKIESEIKEIKILILKSKPIEKKPIKLRGLLKGIKFEEEEIEKVKKSLFKHVYGE
jgi:hypothetical protein